MASKHVKRIRLLDNHLSLQYDTILFKVLGAMSKDSYSYIYECFGIDNADQFIRKRQDKFTSKSVHQIIYYVVWYMAGSDWREFWIVFSFP